MSSVYKPLSVQSPSRVSLCYSPLSGSLIALHPICTLLFDHLAPLKVSARVAKNCWTKANKKEEKKREAELSMVREDLLDCVEPLFVQDEGDTAGSDRVHVSP